MSIIPEGALRNKVFDSNIGVVFFKEDVFVVNEKEYSYGDIADFVKDDADNTKYRIDLHSTSDSLELEIVEDGETFEEMMLEKADEDDESGEEEDNIGEDNETDTSFRSSQGGAGSGGDTSLPSISDHLDMEEERAVEEQILRDEEDRLKKELAAAQAEIEKELSTKVEEEEDVSVVDEEKEEEVEKVGEEEEKKNEEAQDDEDEYDEEIERMLRMEAEKQFQKELSLKRGETVEDEDKTEQKVEEEEEVKEKSEEEVGEIIAEEEEKVEVEEKEEKKDDDDEEEEIGEVELDDDIGDIMSSVMADPDEVMKKLELELEDEENKDDDVQQQEEKEQPPTSLEPIEDIKDDKVEEEEEEEKTTTIEEEKKFDVEDESEIVTGAHSSSSSDEKEKEEEEVKEEIHAIVSEVMKNVEDVVNEEPQQQQKEEEEDVVAQPQKEEEEETTTTENSFKLSKEIYDLFESHYLYPKSSQRLFTCSSLKNRVIHVTEDTLMDDKTMVTLMLESLLMNNFDPKKTFKMFDLIQEKQKNDDRITKWRILKIKKKEQEQGGQTSLFMGTESQGILDTLSAAFHNREEDNAEDEGFPCSITTSRHYALNPVFNKTFEFRLDDSPQPLFYGTLVFEVTTTGEDGEEEESTNSYNKLFGLKRMDFGSFKKVEKVSSTKNTRLSGVHYRFSYHHPYTHFYFCDDDSSTLPPFFDLSPVKEKLTKSVIKDLEFEMKSNLTILRSQPGEDIDIRKLRDGCMVLEKIMRWSQKSRKVLELNQKYFMSLWSVLRKLILSENTVLKTQGLRLFRVLLENENLVDCLILNPPENTLYLEESLAFLYSCIDQQQQQQSSSSKEMADLVIEVTHEFIMKFPNRDVDNILYNFLMKKMVQKKSLFLTLRIIQLVFFTKKAFFPQAKMNIMLTRLKNLLVSESDDERLCEEIINVMLNIFYFSFYDIGGKKGGPEEEEQELDFEMSERKRMVLCIFADSEAIMLDRIHRSISNRIKF